MGLIQGNFSAKLDQTPTIQDVTDSIYSTELHKEVTVREFEEKCLKELQKNRRLNNVTRVMVSNIVRLYETVLECEANVKRNGVMIETFNNQGAPVIKKNEAVSMEDKAVNSIGKLLAQLELDAILDEEDTEV